MSVPSELLYTKTHEWARADGDTYLIGITDYAQSSLGSLVYVGLPQVGDSVKCGESFCDVESVKAVSEVISPLCGEITEVNGELTDAPEKINDAPYEAWFVRVKATGKSPELMTAAEYEKFLAESAE